MFISKNTTFFQDSRALTFSGGGGGSPTFCSSSYTKISTEQHTITKRQNVTAYNNTIPDHNDITFYNAGTRKGQILQARLQLECSSLNSDLHRKNIVPSPFCRCCVFESRNHFFFTCPLYSLDRLRYLPANLDNLTSNDLLFGCENQSDEFNESLFLKVQEFLIRSGKFG